MLAGSLSRDREILAWIRNHIVRGKRGIAEICAGVLTPRHDGLVIKTEVTSGFEVSIADAGPDS
jgi:hypothetical protein